MNLLRLQPQIIHKPLLDFMNQFIATQGGVRVIDTHGEAELIPILGDVGPDQRLLDRLRQVLVDQCEVEVVDLLVII